MQIIELPAHCDRQAAAAIFPELVEAADDGPVLIDAGKVERMGMAMLQLLLATRRSADGLKLVAASDAFASALQLAGQDWIVPEGEPA